MWSMGLLRGNAAEPTSARAGALAKDAPNCPKPEVDACFPLAARVSLSSPMP